MQKMTNKHTRELDIFYNEHHKQCTNCGKKFTDGMCAHLGYDKNREYAVLCDECAYLLSETVVRYHWMEDEYGEVEPNEKLWRYMDLSKFISLISKKKLYFASAESFEDIFEGAKGIVENKDKWNKFYYEFFDHAIRTAPGIEKDKLTEKYVKENAMRLLSELDRSGEKSRKHTFISCWHCNEFESEAMWKLYSLNISNAIAIQTTCQQLYEALDKNPYMKIGKVKYIDYSKRFSSINGAYWYKRKSFEHEKEVRAIVKDFHIDKGLEMSVNLDKLISAVYISPYAPEWFEEVVRDIMEKYNINKPLYYSELLKTPFY